MEASCQPGRGVEPGPPPEYDYEMLHSPRMRETFREAIRPFLGGGEE